MIAYLDEPATLNPLPAVNWSALQDAVVLRTGRKAVVCGVYCQATMTRAPRMHSAGGTPNACTSLPSVTEAHSVRIIGSETPMKLNCGEESMKHRAGESVSFGDEQKNRKTAE